MLLPTRRVPLLTKQRGRCRRCGGDIRGAKSRSKSVHPNNVTCIQPEVARTQLRTTPSTPPLAGVASALDFEAVATITRSSAADVEGVGGISAGQKAQLYTDTDRWTITLYQLMFPQRTKLDCSAPHRANLLKLRQHTARGYRCDMLEAQEHPTTGSYRILRLCGGLRTARSARAAPSLQRLTMPL